MAVTSIDPLAKTPLGNMSESKYLNLSPRYSVLNKPKKTTYPSLIKGVFVALHFFDNSKELMEDSYTKAIYTKSFKLMKKLIKEKDLESLSVEFNRVVNELDSDLYNIWSQTTTGLFLMRFYLNNLDGVDVPNYSSLLRGIDKQLDYISNGSSKDVLRDSVLFAENIIRVFEGKNELNKTKDEANSFIFKIRERAKKTEFKFNGVTHIEKGKFLSFKECLVKFCDPRYMSDYKSFKSKEYFMKKYEVSFKCFDYRGEIIHE